MRSLFPNGPWLGFVSRLISDLRRDSVFFMVKPRYKVNKSRSNPSPTPHNDKCKKSGHNNRGRPLDAYKGSQEVLKTAPFFRWNLKQKIGEKKALWGPRQSRRTKAVWWKSKHKTKKAVIMGCMKRSNFVVIFLKNRCEVFSPMGRGLVLLVDWSLIYDEIQYISWSSLDTS